MRALSLSLSPAAPSWRNMYIFISFWRRVSYSSLYFLAFSESAALQAEIVTLTESIASYELSTNEHRKKVMDAFRDLSAHRIHVPLEPVAQGGIRAQTLLKGRNLRLAVVNSSYQRLHLFVGGIGYEIAIETAFGGAMQNVITETREDAQYLIEYLKSNRAGQVTFLPVDALRPRFETPQIKSACNERGAVGLAIDLVKYDKKYENVIHNLLETTSAIKPIILADSLGLSLASDIRRRTEYTYPSNLSRRAVYVRKLC